MSPDLPKKLEECLVNSVPSGSRGLRFGEIIGLKAGDELDERLWVLEFRMGRRTFVARLRVGVDALTPFGSKEEGIEINEGLPIDGPPLVGPNVGVDPADLIVAGEVSVLFPGSKVTVLSIRVPGCCCSVDCTCMFRNEDGVAGATSAAADIDPVRF